MQPQGWSSRFHGPVSRRDRLGDLWMGNRLADGSADVIVGIERVLGLPVPGEMIELERYVELQPDLPRPGSGALIGEVVADLDVSRIVHRDPISADEIAAVLAVPVEHSLAALDGVGLSGELPAGGVVIGIDFASEHVQLGTGEQNLLVVCESVDHAAR